MKHEVQFKQEIKKSIDDINDLSHIGYTLASLGKGHIVSIDTEQFTAILVKEGNAHCNMFNEDTKDSAQEKVKDLIASAGVTGIYIFDTRKELYQWLAE